MKLDVALVPPQEVVAMRDLYRWEMNCQIVLDSWLGRGWTDSYLLRLDGKVVGYGLVGGVRADPKSLIVEFYVLPPYRGSALPLFRRLASISQARGIETQTNDILLTLMLYDCAQKIESDTVLFEDGLTTHLTLPDIAFRRASPSEHESIFPHTGEPVGDWVIEAGGQIVATGGILFHYNVPYGDIYMEVAKPFRQRGYGSYLVQELKRVCYEMGRVPAARCNASNFASRATLQKAGMLPCARVLTGEITACPDAASDHRLGG